MMAVLKCSISRTAAAPSALMAAHTISAMICSALSLSAMSPSQAMRATAFANSVSSRP